MILFSRRFSLIILTSILFGCSSKHPIENLFESYNKSLMQFAQIQKDSTNILLPKLIRYPERKNIRIKIAEQRIDFSDFITFKKCNLQELIATRNNAMGKVMMPSQQLFYEVEFISRASDCLTKLEDEELKKQLAEIVSIKKKTLQALIWNTTFGSDEFEDMFSISNNAYAINYEKNGISETVSALKTIIRIVDGIDDKNYSFDEKVFENSLKTISRGAVGGKLMRSKEILVKCITESNFILSQLYQNAANGNIEVDDQRKKYLKEIFTEKYIHRLQSHISSINSDIEEYQSAINQLYNLIDVDHGYKFNSFIKQFNPADIESLVSRFKSSISEHTSHWKKLDETLNLNLAKR